MNLKRQLLLVSLLTLMLPWAGCQFIRETESALRSSQQQMLSGTAKAIADSLSRYPQHFTPPAEALAETPNQLYAHSLETAPSIDGYFDDWTLPEAGARTFEGPGGGIRVALGVYGDFLYVFVAAKDDDVVYAEGTAIRAADSAPYADLVRLTSANPPYSEERFLFRAEAPGMVLPTVANDYGISAEPAIRATWQDVPRAYHLEARIPRSRLKSHIGVAVRDTALRDDPGQWTSTFEGASPGRLIVTSPALVAVAQALVQPGMRMFVTDAAGWRLATAGSLDGSASSPAAGVSRWLRYAYDLVVESGTNAELAEANPAGREREPYVVAALDGNASADWFRSSENSRAIVAVSAPIRFGEVTGGVVVLQQGTDAILSLTNQGLARLLNLTLMATLMVAGALLGYATWLSRRIRKLSVAAVDALEHDRLGAGLPSSDARDEIGDLSRSFSSVLGRLGEYNEYLRSLASRLSHELRTPLAIVTSSLDNLEHEALGDAAAGYTKRARDGAERLRRILTAMSEASRVEELMRHPDAETFNLERVLSQAIAAYRDVYPDRGFEYACEAPPGMVHGSPELVIQMLDKLVDNAVSFSGENDTIRLALSGDGTTFRLDVDNPGPPLPARMKGQLFDSMVSVREGDDTEHLGLGLYIARLIADGHNGRIEATDIAGGARFSIYLPAAAL